MAVNDKHVLYNQFRMQKVLFIKSLTKSDATTDRDWQMLQDGVAQELENKYNTVVAAFADLVYVADGKKSRIWHITQGYDIASFDLVVFRRVGDDIEKAIAAAHYLTSRQVPFIDEYLLTEGKGKLAGAFMRSANRIPVPKTFYASAEGYKTIFREQSVFQYPFVLKADNGSKGRDNYLIRDYDNLCNALALSDGLDMVAQEFIPNDGDMRVLVLNDKITTVILRKGKEGSHLNNTSQGGNASLLPVDSMSPQISRDCIRAAKLERLQVAGVDVVIDKYTGKHYFLEVNRAPQLATGAYISQKLTAYSAMIDRLLGDSTKQHRQRRLSIIGRVEIVEMPSYGLKVHARIDTGAKTSAIWASNIREENGMLYFRLFDEASNHFIGEDLQTASYAQTVVASSNGIAETRYKVRLLVVVEGKRINASFTLADRSSQVYPILIGRNVLRGKFLVDSKVGKPLAIQERNRTLDLRSKM